MNSYEKCLLWNDNQFLNTSQIHPLNELLCEPAPAAVQGGPSHGTQCTSHHQCTSLHTGRQRSFKFSSLQDNKFSQYSGGHERKLRQCTSRVQYFSSDDALTFNQRKQSIHHLKCTTSPQPYSLQNGHRPFSISPSGYLMTPLPNTPIHNSPHSLSHSLTCMKQNSYYFEDSEDLCDSGNFQPYPLALAPSLIDTPSSPLETESFPSKRRKTSLKCSSKKSCPDCKKSNKIETFEPLNNLSKKKFSRESTSDSRVSTNHSKQHSKELPISNTKDKTLHQRNAHENRKKPSNNSQKIHKKILSNENSKPNNLISNNTCNSSRKPREELHQEITGVIEQSVFEENLKKQRTIFKRIRKGFRQETTDKMSLISENNTKNNERHTNNEPTKTKHRLFNWKSNNKFLIWTYKTFNIKT